MMSKNNIIDLSEKEKREQIKEVMSFIPSQRIIPMYDSFFGLSISPPEYQLHVCLDKSNAGKIAYDKEAWCVIYENNTMTRYKRDSIAPVEQSRKIYKIRVLAQYIVDMLKTSDVYLFSDDSDFYEKMMELPIKYSEINKDFIYSFNFLDFKTPLNNQTRIDFFLNDEGDYFGDSLSLIRKDRILRFVNISDRLFIMDDESGVIFDIIGSGFSILSKQEKSMLLMYRFMLNGRCFQGEKNGKNEFMGNAFIDKNVFTIINKLKIIKNMENSSNM